MTAACCSSLFSSVLSLCQDVEPHGRLLPILPLGGRCSSFSHAELPQSPRLSLLTHLCPFLFFHRQNGLPHLPSVTPISSHTDNLSPSRPPSPVRTPFLSLTPKKPISDASLRSVVRRRLDGVTTKWAHLIVEISSQGVSTTSHGSSPYLCDFGAGGVGGDFFFFLRELTGLPGIARNGASSMWIVASPLRGPRRWNGARLFC